MAAAEPGRGPRASGHCNYCRRQRPWLPARTSPLTSTICLRWHRVRHEAGEALGAIGTEECLAAVRRHVEDPCLEVAQTCQLALQRIEFFSGAGSEGQAAAAAARVASEAEAPGG